MFTSIIEWLVFLTVVGMIAFAVCAIVYAFYAMIATAKGTVNATIALVAVLGMFAAVFSPVILDGIIPANNWGIAIILACWFAIAPAFVLLSVWAIERK
jgi:hypothetical protein